MITFVLIILCKDITSWSIVNTFLFSIKLSFKSGELPATGRLVINLWCLVIAQELRNPGLIALWADERQRRRDQCEISQLLTHLSQGRTQVKPTKSDEDFQLQLRQLLSQHESLMYVFMMPWLQTDDISIWLTHVCWHCYRQLVV